MTELKSALSRELTVGKAKYKLVVSPQGFKLVLKGKRNGLDIAWHDLINGDAAMAVALRASLRAPIYGRPISRRSQRQKIARRQTAALSDVQAT